MIDPLDARLLDGIRDIARQHLNITDPIDFDTDMVLALRLDSLRLLTLVAELENRYQIILQEGDENDLVTIRDLVRLLRLRGAE